MTLNETLYLLNHFVKKQFGGNDKKWDTLQHNGVLFPSEYTPHNIPLKYENKLIKLSHQAEEFAMIYVKYFNTDYINNKLFSKNFWNDWKKMIPTEIKTLENCDFSEYLQKHVDGKMCKKIKPEIDEKFKIVYVNGIEQEIGNYMIEPAGLFIGRGDNPKIGKIKYRTYPENIIINIGKNELVPKPKIIAENTIVTMENHKWKKVIHNKEVEWIASWKDDITGKTKYVWLSSTSSFKTNNDLKKFELARKLKKKIKNIMNVNDENLKHDDVKIKQLATALYFIYKLALRVGNEKDESDANTFGITTLEIEHIRLDNNQVEFNFLGKDSIHYQNTIEVDDIIRDNLNLFIQHKESRDQIFDLISANDLNTYLSNFMNGLTAKVFRSYNASVSFQKELFKIKCISGEIKTQELLEEYNNANIKIAKLLNHKKGMSKTYKLSVDKITRMIKELKKNIKNNKNVLKVNKLMDKIQLLKKKRDIKEKMKDISLTTSRDNYIDPRITVSFMKRHNIAVDKLFTIKLQKKFKWAFIVDENFVF